MLSKNRRINKKSFDLIWKKGYSFYSDNLSLKTYKTLSGEPSAFAFVVSGKVAKSAVDRNFLKRRGRYTIYKHLKEIKNGYLCVFTFKKCVTGLPYPLFEEEIIGLLRTAKLLK